MNTLYQKFSYGLRWNALESILYQIILLSHQLMLFRVISLDLYGLIGIIFSCLYLTISIIDLGFDISIPSFFLDCTKSRKAFRSLLIPQLIPELSLLFLFCTGIYYFQQYLPITLPTDTILILISLLLLETIKKNLRSFLQMAFLNKKTSLIEIFGLLAYVGIIWIRSITNYPFTLNAILFPMVITSGITVLILGSNLYDFYKNLPDDHDTTCYSHWRIARNRFFNYGTQLTHLFFSSNFLIPLIGLHAGLVQTATLKLISNLTHSITNIIRKTFSLTSDALFSHAKYLDMNTKIDLFKKNTHMLYQSLYCIGIFFIIHYKKILLMQGLPIHNTFFVESLLFLMLQLSEYFFMPYEKFFIVEEQSHFLCLFNILVSLLLFFVITISTLSLVPLLLIVLGFRIASLILMSLISFYTWRLSLPYRLQPITLFYSLSIALLFFMATL